MHHIFVNQQYINNDIVFIKKVDDEENFRHLKFSLRLSLNEKVLCSIIPFNFTFDYLTICDEISDDYIKLKIVDKFTANELPININLYQGLPKYDKFEYIIEKAVELGVNKIIPIAMENCVVKLDKNKELKKIERLNKISMQASIQSKRNIIPEVTNVYSFKEILEKISNNRFNIAFYENAEGIKETRDYIDFIKKNINEKENVNIIIGPEGGFSKKEVELLNDYNVKILTLGKRILRTETASICAISYLMINFER